MRGIANDGARARAERVWTWRHLSVLSLAMAVVVVLCGARDAAAYTLRLTFPDGQAMTHGSACAGSGCLARGDDLSPTNAAGEVSLSGRSHVVEYRRDGIALAQAPLGSASGRILATGDRDTVVLPRLLAGVAPATDVAESDLIARINEERDARGLPLARLNDRLAASADLQAAWLARSAVTWREPELMHVGPFATTLAFRQAEVSLPEPAAGSEVAEVGGTGAEAVEDWMASAPHRALLLADGPLLIGAARAGSFVLVQTHPPCGGCAQGDTGVRTADAAQLAAPVPQPVAPGAPAAPAWRPAAPIGRPGAPAGGPAAPALPPTTAAGGSGGAGCARERLAVRRLSGDERRVRARVRTACLRPGGGYVLVVRRARGGRALASRTVARAGTTTLRLRLGSRARSLRFELRRDRRAVAARSLSLR
ncbi:MAG: hypothetical protein QOG94_2481 [Solirubrobacteraceae bacterium]|nr:hypothetical protein [Solirubrobacteraceae bacterium]